MCKVVATALCRRAGSNAPSASTPRGGYKNAETHINNEDHESEDSFVDIKPCGYLRDMSGYPNWFCSKRRNQTPES